MTAPGDRRDMRPVQPGRLCCRDLLILRLVGADQAQKGAYVGRAALGAGVHGAVGCAAAPQTCDGHAVVAENARGLRRAPQRRAEQPRPLASPAPEGAEGIGSGREAGNASLPDAQPRCGRSERLGRGGRFYDAPRSRARAYSCNADPKTAPTCSANTSSPIIGVAPW